MPVKQSSGKAAANRRRFGKKGAAVIKARQGHVTPGLDTWTREQHKATAAAFAEALKGFGREHGVSKGD
jgi:hypothetical protein